MTLETGLCCGAVWEIFRGEEERSVTVGDTKKSLGRAGHARGEPWQPA